MEKIFLNLLEMSITGSYVALSVMIARVVLKKSPQIFSYLLWSVVFFRFLCPFTLESELSLLPQQTQQISQNFELFSIEEFYVTQSTEKVVEREQATQIFMESTEIEPVETKNSGINSGKISNTEFFMMIWFSGVLVLTLYSFTSLWKMKRVLKSAICFEGNIYFTDKTDSPFVFGLWRPHIYIPSNATEEELSYIIAHENCHIRRFDHITRIICFMTVILHWFNPLVWCSYYLSEQDMELSCDEAVLKKKTVKNRGEYARILLKFSGDSNFITPLAFSKSNSICNLEGRVKNIMKIKNTKLWVSDLSSALVLGLAVGFALEQPETEEKNSDLTEVTFYSGTQNYGGREVVETPILTEEVPFSELLSNVTEVTCRVEVELSNYWVKLTPEDEQWTEMMNIFHNYSLSPIDYDVYPNGGGTYLSDNTLIFDHETLQKETQRKRLASLSLAVTMAFSSTVFVLAEVSAQSIQATTEISAWSRDNASSGMYVPDTKVTHNASEVKDEVFQ